MVHTSMFEVGRRGDLASVNTVQYVGERLLSATRLVLAVLGIGFQVMVMGFVADLIGANRRLIENMLYRIRKFEISKENGHNLGLKTESDTNTVSENPITETERVGDEK